MKYLFNKSLVGIEIGSDSLRIAKIRKTLLGFRVESFGFAKFPEGFLIDGLIKDQNEAARLISKVLEKEEIHETDASVSLNSRFTFFKKVELSGISMEMLERIYIFEAAHHFPFSLKEFTVDYHILKNQGGTISLLFTAARNNVIKNRIDTIKLAGLNPCIIEPDILSVMNLYNLCRNNGHKENLLIIKLDNDCSFVIFPDGTDPSVRFIPPGKKNLESNDSEYKRVFLSSVFEEIRLKKVRKILLTGEDMPHEIIELLKLKVEKVKYFQPFNYLSGKSGFIRYSGLITVPLGLSIRREGDK